VLGAVRLASSGALKAGHDFLGGAQVPLGDDPRFAVDAGGLDKVVVGLLAAPLSHD